MDVGAPLVKKLLHVVGQWRREVHLLAGGGMAEAQCLCMQHLSRTDVKAVLDECLVAAATLTAQNLGASIALVAEQRMADVAHVGTYLMGAPCFQAALHQCYIAESL